MDKPYFQQFWNKFVWDSEQRSLENPSVPFSNAEVLKHFGVDEQEILINRASSITLSAVYRAYRILCDTIASLPLHLIEKTPTGRKISNKDENFIVSKEPNDLMTSFLWREAKQANLLGSGDTFSEIKTRPNGSLKSLDFIESGRVLPKLSKDGKRIIYEVFEAFENNQRVGKSRTVTSDKMLHVPGFGFNGLTGKGIIEIASDSFKGGLYQQNYAKDFTKNNATPSVVLTHQTNIKQEDKEASKKSWQAAHGGKKVGGTAVLTGGWDLKQLSITPEQAQFLESRKFTVIEIARWFGVQPHLLFDLERATFSNIEQQGIEYVTYTIMGWVKRWEMELDRKLFTREERKSGNLFWKFNLNGLQRADSMSRAEYYSKLFNIGSISPQRISELEDEEPIPGGDRYFVNQGTMPLDLVDEVIEMQKSKQNGQRLSTVD